MENYITIDWAAPDTMAHILDEKSHTPSERAKFKSKSRLYYVTGVYPRTNEKRIYIGKAAETSVIDRLKDHMKKHDILYGCTDLKVRIGRITNAGGLDVDTNDLDLVDQAESILIYEFKNFVLSIGHKMKDNEKKIESYTKHFDIDGIDNHGDIDEMPRTLSTFGHITNG